MCEGTGCTSDLPRTFWQLPGIPRIDPRLWEEKDNDHDQDPLSKWSCSSETIAPKRRRTMTMTKIPSRKTSYTYDHGPRKIQRRQKFPGDLQGTSLTVDFQERSRGSSEVRQTSPEAPRTSPEVTVPPQRSTPLCQKLDTLCLSGPTARPPLSRYRVSLYLLHLCFFRYRRVSRYTPPPPQIGPIAAEGRGWQGVSQLNRLLEGIALHGGIAEIVSPIAV